MADAPTQRYELPPRVLVDEDGRHFAVCPACDFNSEVKVTHERDESARFLVSRKWVPTEAGGEWVDDEVTYGETAVFDFSAHEAHVREVHAAVHS